MHKASGIVNNLMRIWLNRTKIADDFSAVIDSMLCQASVIEKNPRHFPLNYFRRHVTPSTRFLFAKQSKAKQQMQFWN